MKGRYSFVGQGTDRMTY